MYEVGFDDGARMELRCSGANNSGSGTLSSEFVVMYFDRPTARQRWPFFVEWRFHRIIERPFNHLLVGFFNPLRDRPLKIKVV